MPLLIDTVVGYAVVGEVISADFFGAFSGTDLLAAKFGDGADALADLFFI